jgi:hypothetical protein
MRTKNMWLAALMISMVTACVQMPTEKFSIVDQRPQISFRFDDAQPIAQARVLVDGLDAGSVGDYADGKASLRLLPGTHVIKVQAGQQTLLNERVYLADGVLRPFNIEQGQP